MKKLMLCMFVCLITTVQYKPVYAGGLPGNGAALESYIAGIYTQIDFCTCEPLPYEVFEKAYRGYLNLRNAGKLSTDKQIITICDMAQSSTRNRMWVIDLAQKKVLFNTYVAHGQGSGDEYAAHFSNNMDSHQSSLGFYVTGDTYDGEHGTSLRLYGMDNGFNSAAYDRGIVVHGADYVNGQFIAGNQRLGRSWGCPAVSSKLSPAIIKTIKDSTCLFIYYPQKNYLAHAYWLNKKIDQLPNEWMSQQIKQPKIIYVYAGNMLPKFHLPLF